MNNQDIYPFLKQYLEIDTGSKNDQQEMLVHELFKKQAEKDGLSYRKVALPSGKAVSVISAVAANSSLRSIILNHHLDTVPTYNKFKPLEPEEPALMKRLVYRGTQDMKTVGVCHYVALASIHRSHKLTRSIHLVIVPDEEQGGMRGTAEFITTDEFKTLNAGFVLDEGMPSGNEGELLIKIGERRPVQLKITVQGVGGHAARLLSQNPLHTIIKIGHKIVELHEQQQQKAALYGAPGNFNSCNITKLSYAPRNSDTEGINVIPDEASLIVDIRRSPYTKLEMIMNLIKQICAPFEPVTISIIASAQDQKTAPKIETLYPCIEKVINNHGMNAKPFIFEATTDSRFYHDRGMEVIGLTPFTCDARLHEKDEYVRMHDVHQGVSIFKDFLIDFCTAS